MSNPSPGPGWWFASDGLWYPQRWEYTYVNWTNEQLAALNEGVRETANSYGRWETHALGVRRGPVLRTHRSTWTHHFSGFPHHWAAAVAAVVTPVPAIVST